VSDLWCLHLRGPDDLIPAPSEQHARQKAERLQAHWERMSPKDDPYWPNIDAVAAPWPYTPEGHAEGLQEHWDEYWAEDAHSRPGPPMTARQWLALTVLAWLGLLAVAVVERQPGLLLLGCAAWWLGWSHRRS
jgi:hypothetical protein